MGIVDAILTAMRKHEDTRHANLEAEMTGVIFSPDPSELPRVIRTRWIEQKGEGYMVPGGMIADGKARLFVGPHTTVNEAAIEWPDA